MVQQYPFINPYTQPSIMPQQVPQQQNTLPQQTVIQVDGKASVDALRMAPNSSVLLMDRTAPIVWLCTSDGLGNVTSEAYDIFKHQETPAVDMSSLEARVSALEEKLNAQSYTTRASKSNARANKSKSARADKADD